MKTDSGLEITNVQEGAGEPAEGPAHKNWGHSQWDDVARFAATASVERLWLFHHKPGRTDIELTPEGAGLLREAMAAVAAVDAELLGPDADPALRQLGDAVRTAFS